MADRNPIDVNRPEAAALDRRANEHQFSAQCLAEAMVEITDPDALRYLAGCVSHHLSEADRLRAEAARL
jgi:hypothetical protein